MVVKSQLKFIKSLHQKKYRTEHGLFFVEGRKTVGELLDSGFKLWNLYLTDPENPLLEESKASLISNQDLKRISALKTPNGVLGVFHIPKSRKIRFEDWIVALDKVQDPGNLGTIIRLCDWFGIRQLLCSLDTVDCYNPKVLQATMGSITRVDIVYADLAKTFQNTRVPVYGTFMDGETIYKENWPSNGILVLGNEANGISDALQSHLSKRIGIPKFGAANTESLNVATAAAIMLNEIRRP